MINGSTNHMSRSLPVTKSQTEFSFSTLHLSTKFLQLCQLFYLWMRTVCHSLLSLSLSLFRSHSDELFAYIFNRCNYDHGNCDVFILYNCGSIFRTLRIGLCTFSTIVWQSLVSHFSVSKGYHFLWILFCHYFHNLTFMFHKLICPSTLRSNVCLVLTCAFFETDFQFFDEKWSLSLSLCNLHIVCMFTYDIFCDWLDFGSWFRSFYCLANSCKFLKTTTHELIHFLYKLKKDFRHQWYDGFFGFRSWQRHLEMLFVLRIPEDSNLTMSIRFNSLYSFWFLLRNHFIEIVFKWRWTFGWVWVWIWNFVWTSRWYCCNHFREDTTVEMTLLFCFLWSSKRLLWRRRFVLPNKWCFLAQGKKPLRIIRTRNFKKSIGMYLCSIK